MPPWGAGMKKRNGSLSGAGFLLLALTHVCAAASAARDNHAKRHRFKNLPEIAVTASATWSAAAEFNLFPAAVIANVSVDYGLDHGWNLGLSVLNLEMWQEGGHIPWNPDGLVNIEKNLVFGENWTAVIGTQNGAAFWDRSRRSRVESYSYADNQIRLWDDKLVAHFGGYLASTAMTGPGDRVGFLAGLRVPLGHERWQLALDYVSGNNALGTGTIQLFWQIAPGWRLDLGMQLPAPGSPNQYGALFGIGWH